MGPVYSGLPLYIQINTGWIDGDGQTQAITAWEGCAIFFHGPAIETMDEGVLSVLIAHELAHCFQYSQGPREYESREEKEKEAIAIALRWGFEEAQLEAWAMATPVKSYAQ